MKNLIVKNAAFAGMALLITQPAHACWNKQAQDALKIKHLNTMLMATALRCRMGGHDFLPQYNAFVKKHNRFIGTQNAAVKAQLRKNLGAKGALSASDRLSVGYANKYGAGHPSMNCKALKILTKKLVSYNAGSMALLDAANQTVGYTQIPGKMCRQSSNKIARK